MVRRFETVLLEGAIEFLRHLEEKPKNKILQNIERASFISDATLLKKIEGEIWEFRTLYAGIHYRLLPFGIKAIDTVR